jgi:DNA-binding winged helix-turn-helix (wHTH) protein/Tol biopolymer transport system component
MSQSTKHVYAFGDFLLDPTERSLVHNGEPVALTPKVFDALLLLVENAGHLVEKDEFMRRLWPDTFVGDDTLAQNISLLRKALADGVGGLALIVTVPRLGYRFSGEVHEQVETAEPSLEGESEVAQKTSAEVEAPPHREPLPPKDERRSRFRMHPAVLISAAIVTGTLAALLTYWLLAKPAIPRLTRTAQITYSGRVDPWGQLVSDGARIYFLEREGDHWNLVQTSLAGGDTQLVAAPFRNTLLLGLSPNHAEFLVASFLYRETEMPLWTWPVQGGPPTRIGDLVAYDAAWHPDGRHIVYARYDGVFLADRDGSHSHKLAATHGRPHRFAWSPDGSRLTFSVFPAGLQSSSIWEMNADGRNVHQRFSGWHNPPVECCGAWSQDGRYFLFGAVHGGVHGFWGVREKGSFPPRDTEKPFLISAGKPDLDPPILTTSEPRTLYAVGSIYKAEMVTYNQNSWQFITIFADKNADFVTYSRDGQWVAYVIGPDNVLWKEKTDGSGRVPLTSRSVRAIFPSWSPDGKQLAFVDRSSVCENKLFLISAEGGTPRELFPNECQQFDPAWSPDGKFLTFASDEVLLSGAPATSKIELLDLATNHRFTLPGSEGMRSPSWSPDGSFIAAVGEDLHRLMLFDVAKKSWTELARGTLFNGTLSWSRDGASLYFQDLAANHQAISRLWLADHHREEVVNFESYIRAGVPRCFFFGLTPDGSPIASLLRNHADVYALEVSLP